MRGFFKTCEWLESETDSHTVKDFRVKLQDNLGEKKVYGIKHLKSLLKGHYGSHNHFSQDPGKPSKIYLVDMTKYIIGMESKS